ncbi:hypothetical protein PoB_005356200 [Plakobranchus ocellatus]|uniref:Uncharacterized protein n=1 Tax=Plakobranchus ocellatus TaxID=259542 RepID=A0AAV4C641_9GAST|nr:hypothetical protein PoB_005356200 [Plakobranchus ocellatus]
MLKTDGGGPAEPMDKMSEGIIDLLPDQFAAIENEFDEDYIIEKGGSSGQSHETATKSAASTPSTPAEAPSIFFLLKSGKKKKRKNPSTNENAASKVSANADEVHQMRMKYLKEEHDVKMEIHHRQLQFEIDQN